VRVKTAMRRSEQLRRIAIIILISLVISSRHSIPSRVKQTANENGIAGNHINQFAGITFLYTIGWVPGKKAPNLKKRRVTCKTNATKATVIWESFKITKDNAILACYLITHSIKYINRFITKKLPSMNWQLYLVPAGTGAKRKSFSWAPLGTLKPTYVAHWYQNMGKNESNIVDTYAHESVHIKAALLSAPSQDYHDEYIANLAGTCAQLHVNGLIRKSGYVVAKPDSPKYSYKYYLKSMDASWMLASKLYPLFGENEIITSVSRRGKKLVHYCNDQLSSFFGK
jgi:hypothetical protein